MIERMMAHFNRDVDTAEIGPRVQSGADKIIVGFMVELLSTLAAVTKQVKHNQPSKSDHY
jgi:hypothetical protein